jgi:hypothetical protein
MPYDIVKVKGGYQVTSPNHPEGHSKSPMTLANAQAQMRIMQETESGHAKAKAHHSQKNRRPE